MMFEHPNLLILFLPVLFVGIKMLLAKKRRFLVVMRVLVLFLLIFALANPYTLKLTKTQDEAPSVVVVDDTTNSMDVFKTGESEADAIVAMLKDKTPTSKRVIPSGDKTMLGDAIITYSSQADHIILVSDLNSNHGREIDDALEVVSRTGATVYAIKQDPVKNDLSIELVGSKNIIVDNENQFRAIVRQAKDTGQTSYDIEVSVDGKTILREGVTQKGRANVISVSHTFETLGVHEMKAVIIPSGEDALAENNMFYKSIYVVPKPKILLVSPDRSLSSPLSDVLTSLYDVTTTSAIPDFDGYKGVVLDDLPLSYLGEDEISKLKGFVSEGGGLVAVGGPRSYERGGYLDSSLESILPVESVASKYLGNDTNIVVLIDVSGSTAASWANLEDSKRSDVSNFIAGMRASIYGEDTEAEEVSVLDLQKAQAISIIRNFKSRDNVGVIAFSGSAHIVPDDNATTLFRGSDTAILEDPLMRLQSTTGTVLHPAQEKAWRMLNQTAPGGNNYVVIISDGMFTGGEDIADRGLAFGYSKDLTEQMYENGIRTYTVFMGFSKYIETDAAYKQMKTLADLGGGNVLVPDAYERLKVTFDDEPPEQDEDKEPEETGITYPLEVFDDTHFITRSIAIVLQGDVAGFNDVTDKAGAKRLVTTDKGKPIVTVWNFGLGHVASVTTDDGRAWGGVLYAGDNARLMPTTINWAIRNPMPDKDGTITADDVWLGDEGAVSVQSSSVPTVTYQGTDVNLVRVVADIYRGSITPKKSGFSTIGGYGVATNYPLEYRNVGFNDNVAASVTQSGGYVYTLDEAREKLFDDVKKSSERASVEPVDQSMIFILAALVLYFMEIAIRRIGEIMRMKRETKYHNERRN